MSNPITLSRTDAACLNALRAGADRKMLIAINARLNLSQTGTALKSLESLGFAATKDGRLWYLTQLGIGGAVLTDTPPHKRGRKPGMSLKPGPAARRLLACLDRPRRSLELPAMLNTSRQRVHQLLIGLLTLDLIRSAEPEHPTAVVARKDDPSLLLRQDQERVLSAFPQTSATTLPRLTKATGMRAAIVGEAVRFLNAEGLIEKTGTTNTSDQYKLTPAGSAHWQRSSPMRRADLPPSPLRTDRVLAILTYLEGHGPTQSRDIGPELGIPASSVNTLMEHLKQINAITSKIDHRYAPYFLTADGRQMLMAMRQGRPL